MIIEIRYDEKELPVSDSAKSVMLVAGIAGMMHRTGFEVTDVGMSLEANQRVLTITTEGKLENSLLERPVIGDLLQQALNYARSAADQTGAPAS